MKHPSGSTWLQTAPLTLLATNQSLSRPLAMRNQVTVVLAAKANGSKLPPFIVFKGKRVDKGLEKVTGVVCVYSENGWMNEDLTHRWLKKVWGTLAFSRRLLCWDAYRCHIQDSTKQLLSKLKTDAAAVIPGGCTSLLQAADVAWNKPFKTYYREIYEDWLNDGEKATKGGNMKPPTRVQLATWVKAAWDKVLSCLWCIQCNRQ